MIALQRTPERAAIVFVAVLGCSGKIARDTSNDAEPATDAQPEATPTDAVEEGVSDTVPPIEIGPILPSCVTESPAVVATGLGFRATTTHYAVYVEGTLAEATDLARLLEASSATFAIWFDRAPPVDRMKVQVFRDEATWAAALAADGIAAPTEAGGYYDPTTKTAYLFRQSNVYTTHMLALHEATHQYHFVTRGASRGSPFWYTEGHAEYLSRHDWDGTCVLLGVTPLLTSDDLPSKTSAPLDVPKILSGTTDTSRADAWALFRYLDTGALRDRFRTYRDAFDAGKAPSFAALVAPPDSLTAPVTLWVPSAQEPMRTVFGGWVHVGPGAVSVDTAGAGYFTVAEVKAWPLTHLEAKLEIPASGKWTAGVLVSYTDPTHFVAVVHGRDNKVRKLTVSGSASSSDLGTAPPPSGGFELLSVDYTSARANVSFNGWSFSVLVGSLRAGLVASDTTGSFVDVSWSP